MKIIIKRFKSVENMNKTRNPISHTKIKYQNGFTLIELLVATAISIIVLLAASSTFITTYKLNQEVKERIEYENDVRNATDLFRTDARQIGNFGCQNHPELGELNNEYKNLFATSGTQFVSTTSIPKNLVDSQYGNNVLSVDPINGSKPITMVYSGGQDAGGGTSRTGCNFRASVSETAASIYVVGTTSINKNPALYRIRRISNIWGEPELLVNNVQNMSLTFYYDKHGENDCPQTDTPVESNLQKFDDISKNSSRPPILIEANLTICSGGKFKDNKCENQVIDYTIQAMVRKGEVCS